MRGEMILACAAMICGVLVSAADAGDGTHRTVIYDREVFEVGFFQGIEGPMADAQGRHPGDEVCVEAAGYVPRYALLSDSKGEDHRLRFQHDQAQADDLVQYERVCPAYSSSGGLRRCAIGMVFGTMPEQQNGYISSSWRRTSGCQTTSSKCTRYRTSEGKKVLLITWASW